MILIIGYGNPLRGDDSVGQHIAWTLQHDWKRSYVQVLAVYQLTPELVEDISRVNLVIFIDARIGDTPGTIIHEAVHPKDGTGAFTHHVTPSSLLAASRQLYGVCPMALSFTVIGRCFDYDEALSPEVEAAIPALIENIERIVQYSHQRETFYE